MSTPPLSSSSSSASSPSPSIHASDDFCKNDLAENMPFDDPETIELLLQTITQNSNPDTTTPAPNNTIEDWERMSAWVAQDAKSGDFGSDFNFAFPMDLDMDPLGISTDPTSLHFNTSIFSQAAVAENPYYSTIPQMGDMSAASIFPYDNTVWPTTDSTGRRLSVTSSSSSSGASLSPILEPQSASSPSQSSESAFSEPDPAAELAQRVRQAAGVTLAVPVSPQVRQLAAAGAQAESSGPRMLRLAPPKPVAPKVQSTTAEASSTVSEPISRASPAASTSSDVSNSPSPSSQSSKPDAPATTALGRPKTSHTTIERRYRTNLNARITGLKQAVPALRVLELKNGAASPYNDVVDSRGFVDGVKVARKMSKANILGKATEYIRVLKKRESRLKREHDGLKSLIGGLVGGPALLKEWEREWRERFGGEEADEVEGDDAAAASDDEDGDGEDSDGEDEDGRARKKAKVTKAPKKEKPQKPAPPPPVPAVPGAVPEKRKRGRPRKIPLPPAVPATTMTPMEGVVPVIVPQSHVPMQQDFVAQPPQSGQQYLLAVFAFFSLFNSPLANNYHRDQAYPDAHVHHGSVLTTHHTAMPPITVPRSGYGTQELIQAFHLLVSTLVFFYVVFPWLSGVLKQSKLLPNLIHELQRFSSRPNEDSKALVSAASVPLTPSDKRAILLDALSPCNRGTPQEAIQLRRALGVTTGVFGLMQSVIKAARIDRGLEMNQLEQRAWVRLGELVAFDDSVSKTTRLQTYWCMSWHVSTFATSISDLTTLALIILPVSRTKATELWERARAREILRPYERIVLSNMTVEEAAEWLVKWRDFHNTERKGDRCAACEKRTPLGILAAILTRARLRKHAAAMFVRTVIPTREQSADTYETDDLAAAYDVDQDDQDDQQRKEAIEAGKSIGGRTAELATLLERIWDTGFCSHEDVMPRSYMERRDDSESPWDEDHDLARHDEAEIRSLLSATIIYRRIFPSSFPSCATAVSVILSPPPSPSRKNLALHVSLRAALASSAFDFVDQCSEDDRLGAALEDARDRVNDMLTALERSVRRNAKAM